MTILNGNGLISVVFNYFLICIIKQIEKQFFNLLKIKNKIMSRLHRENVWDFHINTEASKCLCCNYTIMKKNAKKGEEGEWDRGHIIHHKDQGPDIYENVRPICIACNKKDKNCKDSFDYMVKIKSMTNQQRTIKLEEIKRLARMYFENPKILHCKSYLNSGDPCPNKKKPHSEYCGIHGSNKITALEAMPIDIKMFVLEQLVQLKHVHKNTYNLIKATDSDDEILQDIKRMANETQALYEELKRPQLCTNFIN
jgi:hypothetical protein